MVQYTLVEILEHPIDSRQVTTHRAPSPPPNTSHHPGSGTSLSQLTSILHGCYNFLPDLQSNHVGFCTWWKISRTSETVADPEYGRQLWGVVYISTITVQHTTLSLPARCEVTFYYHDTKFSANHDTYLPQIVGSCVIGKGSLSQARGQRESIQVWLWTSCFLRIAQDAMV